jgi:superfamily II DNA/RNA helicase
LQEEEAKEELIPLLEDLNEDPVESQILPGNTSQGAVNTEVDQIKSIIEMLDEIKVDSKAEVLLANLEELAKSKVPKVLIFTEYRGTQDYLAGLLSEAGWNVNLFHGSQTAQKKDDSVEAFRTGEGRQILIATEAGAEGRNFQFCHMLINYDLPWNPMTVEQRIGRIDRMGQENTVMVFNFCVKDSIEERVLDVLERRINLFEATVGGLDPILGDVAGDLREIMQKAREDRPAAIDDLGKRLEAQVEEARKADARLQDLFMDTKSYSVNIAERIKGQQGLINAAIQEDFMKRLFKVHNTSIKANTEFREYEVCFYDPFLKRHPELFRHDEDRRRRAVFRSDERPGAESVQYMAFGHPVVEAAMSDVVQPKWRGAVGARGVTSGPDIDPVNGWLLIYEIEVSDVRPRTIFVPAFIADGGACDVEVGEKLVLRALSDIPEKLIQIDEHARNMLRNVRPIADEYVADVMAQTIQQLQNSASEKVERESVRLNKYYEKLHQNCQERIQATQDTLNRFEESDDDGQKRVIPMWQKRLTDLNARVEELNLEKTRRLALIGALQNPSCTPRLLQVSRIEVKDKNK